jgi:rRNA maturation endonuclease Nob1
METSSAYQSYIASIQNLEPTEGRKKYQEPFKESFEAIYEKATQTDVKLDSAKSFLESLSQDELTTLQKYTGLADPINIQGLSQEGAYNLLMHDNERYDFDANGTAEVGLANTALSVPQNMPSAEREAFVKTLNSLDDKERMMVSMLTLDLGRISAEVNGEKYTSTKFDYSYLKNRVDSILNPQAGAFSSEEVKNSISNFWNIFESNYTGDKTVEQEEKRDSAVQKFVDELLSKGALKFLSDFNLEKIEEKVEQYREKLLKDAEQSGLSATDIDKLVSDYKKSLLEELQESIDNDDKTPLINKSVMIKMMLEITQAEKNNDIKPLDELIQNTP